MGDKSTIEWTDATWNPITGCSVVSAGCTNCYAMRLAGGRLRNHPSRHGLTRVTGLKSVWTGEVRFNEQWLDAPLRWRRPRMIFVCAHGDLFHENVPDEWIDRVFAVMARAPHHTFQVLTKRQCRARSYLKRFLSADDASGCSTGWVTRDGARAEDRVGPLFPKTTWPLLNVWLGVSVEDQATADERIPVLLDTPAAVRWVSAEPLLGPVDLRDIAWAGREKSTRVDSLRPGWVHDRGETKDWPRIDWVVAGGESGPRARPSHPGWFLSLRDQCAAAGVPFLFKQWGEWAPWAQVDDDGPVAQLQLHYFGSKRSGSSVVHRYGKKRAGRMLDGRWHDVYPSRVNS